MNGGPLQRAPRRRRPPRVPVQPGSVVEFVQVHIERAIAGRERYRYVRPRVEREGRGWRIVSPNCSRNIDPAGGEIAIAWLVPANEGLWLLHARDHARDCWHLTGAGLTLAAALERVCADPQRVYWP